MDEKLRNFLELVPHASWRRPPPVWSEQLRAALSEGYVKVGFGGGLHLSEAGKLALSNSKSGGQHD